MTPIAPPTRLALPGGFDPRAKRVQPKSLAEKYGGTPVSHVLVIDDNKEAVIWCADFLKIQGLYVTTIIVKHQSLYNAVNEIMVKKPDLIVMDGGMRNFMGNELTFALRQAGYKGIIVINSTQVATTTSSGDSSLLDKMIRAGANFMLPVKNRVVDLFPSLPRAPKAHK